VKPKAGEKSLPVAHQLIVYGYVCAEVADEIEIAAWHKKIALFCEREGYELHGIRTDRGVSSAVLVRPGFVALLEVLELATSHGVVVVSLDHISKANDVRAHLYRPIRRAASVVIEVHQEADDCKESSA